jgi:Flp pilus assembly protein TadD
MRNYLLGCPGAVFLALSLPSASALAQVASWDGLAAEGKKAREAGQYGKAVELFTAAIKEAETLGPDNLPVAALLNELGMIHCDRGQYAEAERLLVRAEEAANLDARAKEIEGQLKNVP